MFTSRPLWKWAFRDKPAKTVKDHPPQRFKEYFESNQHKSSEKKTHAEMPKQQKERFAVNSALADQETKC